MNNMLKFIFRSFLSLAFCMLCFTYPGFGQSVRELIREADVYMQKGNVDLAIANYLEAESRVPANSLLALKLGKAYLQSSFKYKALPYLEAAYKKIPSADPDIKLYLAGAHQYSYNFDEAVSYYQSYMQDHPGQTEEIKKKIEACYIAANLYGNPRDVKIVNLGSSVNSPENDFSPLITPDENMLVFTSRRKGSTGGKKTENDEYFEDIYLTYRINDSLWTKPQNISKNINTPYHDAAAALSPDGKKLFVYSGEGGGDLYLSEFNGLEWSKPKSLGSNVNTEYWETSVTITADGKSIYFASNRPGGYGKLDIYVSNLQEDGKWGPARNMGPAINTAGDEDSPFVHPDGQTLYFSSNGHPGLGGFDIFKSEMVNGAWAAVENFGYPVNTTDDDAHFVMSGNRKKAYFTSVKEDGIGKADIYAITFPYNTSKPQPPRELLAQANINPDSDREKPQLQPQEAAMTAKPAATEAENMPEPATEPFTVAAPVPEAENMPEAAVAEAENVSEPDVEAVLPEEKIVLSGNVSDYAREAPLHATVSLTNNETAEVVAEDTTDPETGNFALFVYGLGGFGLNIESEGFLFYSKNIQITEADQKKGKKEINVDVKMHPAEVGSTMVLSNIFFNTNEFQLRPASYAELDKIVKYLQKTSNMKIQINGHTDNVGDPRYNKELSRKRAESVKAYLVKGGIDQSRMQVMGYGEERPLVSNDDEIDGREINRRTEIEVLAF